MIPYDQCSASTTTDSLLEQISLITQIRQSKWIPHQQGSDVSLITQLMRVTKQDRTTQAIKWLMRITSTRVKFAWLIVEFSTASALNQSATQCRCHVGCSLGGKHASLEFLSIVIAISSVLQRCVAFDHFEKTRQGKARLKWQWLAFWRHTVYCTHVWSSLACLSTLQRQIKLHLMVEER